MTVKTVKVETGVVDTDQQPPDMWPMQVHVVKALEANTTTPHSKALSVEDEFENLYFGPSAKDAQVLQPPFNPRVLVRLCTENNTLLQCVDAMEVNIDGTGFEIETENPKEESLEDLVDSVTEFFQEPWPRVSFVTMRRQLRRDLESTGNAYLEVIRNANDEITFLRVIESVSMRLMRLSELNERTEVIVRNGESVEVNIASRDRGFAQTVGQRVVYFREYGAFRDINRKTGKWEDVGVLERGDRGNEVLHFRVTKDTYTPYGLPRWINNLPSVLGSREAEELNLNFFEAGGIPPILLMLAGGSLTEEGKKTISALMGGKAKDKLVAAVVEAQPTSGNLDANSTMKLQVERFGSEKQNDSMFENYDEKCSERVRTSFRLAPIFLGKSQDYSFATAAASYEVTEAQVFRPERMEFDEVMRVTIVRELSQGRLTMRSMGLSIKDVNTQLQGIELAAGQEFADPESIIPQINEIANIEIGVRDAADVQADKDAEAERLRAALDQQGDADGDEDEDGDVVNGPRANAPPQPDSGPSPSDSEKSGDPSVRVSATAMKTLLELAEAQHAIIVGGGSDVGEIRRVQSAIGALKSEYRRPFYDMLAKKVFGDDSGHDPEGARELVATAAIWCDRIREAVDVGHPG